MSDTQQGAQVDSLFQLYFSNAEEENQLLERYRTWISIIGSKSLQFFTEANGHFWKGFYLLRNWYNGKSYTDEEMAVYFDTLLYVLRKPALDDHFFEVEWIFEVYCNKVLPNLHPILNGIGNMDGLYEEFLPASKLNPTIYAANECSNSPTGFANATIRNYKALYDAFVVKVPLESDDSKKISIRKGRFSNAVKLQKANAILITSYNDIPEERVKQVLCLRSYNLIPVEEFFMQHYRSKNGKIRYESSCDFIRRRSGYCGGCARPIDESAHDQIIKSNQSYKNRVFLWSWLKNFIGPGVEIVNHCRNCITFFSGDTIMNLKIREKFEWSLLFSNPIPASSKSTQSESMKDKTGESMKVCEEEESMAVVNHDQEEGGNDLDDEKTIVLTDEEIFSIFQSLQNK
jgi:hypothetical protein